MIEIGTKVKIKKDETDTFLMSFNRSWFEDIREVTQITNDEPPRYYVSGLYWFDDDLIVYSKEEYPEYYI